MRAVLPRSQPRPLENHSLSLKSMSHTHRSARILKLQRLYVEQEDGTTLRTHPELDAVGSGKQRFVPLHQQAAHTTNWIS